MQGWVLAATAAAEAGAHHGMGDEVWLKDAVVFLVAAGVVVPLFRLLRVSAVLGFLIAGVALGPGGLGRFAETWPWLETVTVTEPAAAAPFAELGVLFLLFLLGLELSFQRLWAMRRIVFGAGGAQAAGSALIIGAGAALFGLTAPAAAVIGLALALSSTAIVMQILTEERRAASPAGRAAFGVLLMQDILVAPILILVGFLARGSEAGVASLVFEALVQGALALGLIFVIGRFALRRIFGLAARAGGRDLLMALTLLTVVGAALITAGAGLSLALGAFLAGLLLGETEFKHQAEVDLEPFKGLLLGVFFMSTGMAINLDLVWAQAPLLLAALLGLLVLKAAVAYGAARLGGMDRPAAVEAAFLLAPAGEFAFIILAAASAGAVVGSDAATLVAAIAGVSMLITPALGALGRRLAQRLGQKFGDMEPSQGVELDGHVVVAGFGRIGRTMARILKAEGADVLALDRSPAACAAARADGWRAYLGDASRPEILERAGAEHASLFAVTVDDPESACAMVRAARALRPDAPIFARARDAEHARRLREAGATHVTPDAIEAAMQLGARALEAMGLPPDAVRDRITLEREDEYARAEVR
jgi:CPA2 family monovalent cation:H+ antiporter-2